MLSLFPVLMDCIRRSNATDNVAIDLKEPTCWQPRRCMGDGLTSIVPQLAVTSASGSGLMIGHGFPEVRSGWRGSDSGLP